MCPGLCQAAALDIGGDRRVWRRRVWQTVKTQVFPKSPNGRRPLRKSCCPPGLSGVPPEEREEVSKEAESLRVFQWRP